MFQVHSILVLLLKLFIDMRTCEIPYKLSHIMHVSFLIGVKDANSETCSSPVCDKDYIICTTSN